MRRRKRAGQSRLAAERLNAALWFAYLDLTELRRADLTTVRRRLQTFLSPGRPESTLWDTTTISSGADARALSRTDLDRLQRRLRRFLEDRFRDNFTELVSHDISSARLSRGLRIYLVPSDIFAGDRTLRRWTEVSLEGRVDDCFLLLVGLALVELDTARVRRCPRCRRVFYHARRRSYCTECAVSRPRKK